MLEKVQEEQERDEAGRKDEVFDLFQSVCSKNPEQVLRYVRHCKGIGPLWYHGKGLATQADAVKRGTQKCKHCGGAMRLEMQIMPQIFNYVKQFVNVDWGTILIYTYRWAQTKVGARAAV